MKYSLKGSNHEDIVTRIFENRNIDINNKKAFLNPSRSAIQHPLTYKNMEQAGRLYIDTINQNGKIVVVVDPDADGYCSSATLINYTKYSLKYNNIEYVLHDTKKHGLTKQILAEILEKNPVLVIVPDAGSNDYEEHKFLLEHGIRTIVIDHHESEKYSECAIVVNNQLNENGNKTLSGAGMVLKFLEHIDTILEVNQIEYYYDLVAVALVADGMLMTDEETRYYVLEGLDDINNPFLQKLTGTMEEGSFEFISYKIAPVINAVIRVGTKKDKKDLFDALTGENRLEIIKLRGQGEVEMSLVDYIIKIADRLKSKQTRDIKKILEHEETIILTENYPITMLIHDNEDAQALSGLIASKLVHEYKKPALVLRRIETENGKVRYDGSGRTVTTFPNFKDYLSEMNKFTYCEGHQGAFGVSITSDNISSFLTFLLHQTLPNVEQCFIVDKAYTEGRVSSFDISAIDELNKYWCKGFEKPKFYIKLNNIDSKDITTMGVGDTSIKISHDYISYVKFRCNQEERERLLKQGKKDLEIIGTFNINEWAGKCYPQVMVEHIEIHDVKEVDDFKDIDFKGFNAFAI